MKDARELDCHKAAEHLYELLDQELTPGLEAAVREHIENCERCFPRYNFELAFKRFLEARAKTQGAPEALRHRIFEQLILSEDAIRDG